MATDGLWIDQERDVLYVGQLFDGDVLAWNISDAGRPKSLGRVPGASLSTGSFLDDFTLSKSGARIIGCDWSGSKIVEMPAWPGETFLEGRGLDGTSVLVEIDSTSHRGAYTITIRCWENNPPLKKNTKHKTKKRPLRAIGAPSELSALCAWRIRG